MILVVAIRASLFVMDIKFPINRTQIAISHKGLLYNVFTYLLFGPTIEELGFRLGLKYSSINFSIMTSCSIFFLLTIFYFPTSEDVESINNFIVSITIALIFGLIIFFSLKYLKEVDRWMADFWIYHKRSIFYFSVFLFSCFHFFNFELDLKTLLVMPLVTLPQSMYGIIFGFIRLKYGIFYSILLHSLVNFLAFTPTFLDYIK